jgi:hypothetical protein
VLAEREVANARDVVTAINNVLATNLTAAQLKQALNFYTGVMPQLFPLGPAPDNVQQALVRLQQAGQTKAKAEAEAAQQAGSEEEEEEDEEGDEEGVEEF